MHNVSNNRVFAGCGSDEETQAPAVYTTSGNSGFVTRWRRHAVTCFVDAPFGLLAPFPRRCCCSHCRRAIQTPSCDRPKLNRRRNLASQAKSNGPWRIAFSRIKQWPKNRD